MHTDSPLRIGITTRITQAICYEEIRDSLAQDWATYLGKAVPRAIWQALPNEGAKVVERFKAWELNGLILSGGNDIGEYPAKDKTDLALLAYALEHGIPVFGVCRGLQIIAHFYDVPLERCPGKYHAGARHKVNILDTSTMRRLNAPQTIEVNSYHAFIIRPETLTAHIEIEAVSDDGSVEAVTVRGRRAAGVMWHPEREIVPDDFTVRLMRWIFGVESRI